MVKKIQVPAHELRRLLLYINNFKPDACIRFRLIGDMWQTSYMRVVNLTEKGVTLNDEKDNKLIIIKDLNSIIQFELDQPLERYQPHFHYSVDLEHSRALDS